MKNTNNIITLSFLMAISGILIILVLSNTISPIKLDINEITEKHLKKTIQTKGTVINIKNFKGNFQIISIEDKAKKIDITLNSPININKNQSLIVIGVVSEYKDNLQINAKEIIIKK